MRRRTATLDREAGRRLRHAAIERLVDLDQLYGPPGGLLDALPWMHDDRDRLAALRAADRSVPITLDARRPEQPDPVAVPDEHRLVVLLHPDDRITSGS